MKIGPGKVDRYVGDILQREAGIISAEDVDTACCVLHLFLLAVKKLI